MDPLLLVARLLLAAVFAVAGLAKLADRAGARQAVIGFGLPAGLAGPLGLVLPLAELAVAAALLPAASARWGALGALALLLLFVAGIGANLARGRTPDCHCFGQLHSAPIGRGTLARNAALAALAGLVAWRGAGGPGSGTAGWLGGLSPLGWLGLGGGLLALGALAVEGWLLAHVLRQNGRLLDRLEALEAQLPTSNAAPAEGLPVGAAAPPFDLADLDGETVTLDGLRARGKPLLLVFSHPGCGPCNALLPDLGRWQRSGAARAALVVLSQGTAEANRAKAAGHGLTDVLLQRDAEVDEAYRVAGTPSAVLVRPDGTIGSPVAAGADQIRLLVARTMGPPDLPSPLAATGGNGHGQRAGTLR